MPLSPYVLLLCPVVFVFAILETFMFSSVSINALMLITSFRPILFLCLRFLITKCSLQLTELLLKKVTYLFTYSSLRNKNLYNL